MEINNYKKQVAKACKRYDVKKLYVFGSVARGDSNESDVDLVAEFNNLYSSGIADRYFNFIEELESIFKKRVDLIEESSIKNPIFRRVVDREKMVVYG